jgi:hypothetical protein
MPGSDVTFANAFAQFGKVAKIVDEVQKFGSANTPNLLDMLDGLTTILDGEFTPSMPDRVRRAVLGPVAGGLTRSTLRQMFRPAILEMLRAIGSSALTPDASVSDAIALREIRQYMEDNAQLIKSRNMTFDTSAAGSTTGTGAISRLTVDKDSNNLECTGAESKVFYCDVDQNSPGGQKHNEEFEFRFSDADPTGLQWVGTGGVTRIRSLHAKSHNLLVNPSFETGALSDGTALASMGQLTGWDVATAANWKTRSSAAYVYRGFAPAPASVTFWGLECIASDSIAQVVKNENPGAQFSRETPYHAQVAWQRRGSATGTLTFHLGSQSVAVDISTGVNDAWNVLQIPLTSARYYDNFKEADLDVKVVVSSLATGTVVIDDVVIAPMTNLDGTWWAVTGGATPWMLGDTLTFSGDSQGTATILAYWLWRAYGDLVVAMRGWFPSTTTASSIVIAEPT